DFLNGDPDQPIIMGRTYHQENRTPGSLPGTKTQMTIRSKTYMGSGFNELKFDDATCNQVNHLIPTRVLVKGGEITCKILK
ncbi:hypothetical protein ACQ65K_005044, partial [Escherichia coli]